MNSALKYELERLESIISNNLLRARGKNVRLTVEQSADIKEILREEVERIEKKFVHEIFAFEDERHLERYIQFHQQELFLFSF